MATESVQDLLTNNELALQKLVSIVNEVEPNYLKQLEHFYPQKVIASKFILDHPKYLETPYYFLSSAMLDFCWRTGGIKAHYEQQQSALKARYIEVALFKFRQILKEQGLEVAEKPETIRQIIEAVENAIKESESTIIEEKVNKAIDDFFSDPTKENTAVILFDVIKEKLDPLKSVLDSHTRKVLERWILCEYRKLRDDSFKRTEYSGLLSPDKLRNWIDKILEQEIFNSQNKTMLRDYLLGVRVPLFHAVSEGLTRTWFTLTRETADDFKAQDYLDFSVKMYHELEGNSLFKQAFDKEKNEIFKAVLKDVDGYFLSSLKDKSENFPLTASVLVYIHAINTVKKYKEEPLQDKIPNGDQNNKQLDDLIKEIDNSLKQYEKEATLKYKDTQPDAYRAKILVVCRLRTILQENKSAEQRLIDFSREVTHPRIQKTITCHNDNAGIVLLKTLGTLLSLKFLYNRVKHGVWALGNETSCQLEMMKAQKLIENKAPDIHKLAMPVAR